jgi:hypothetical protein
LFLILFSLDATAQTAPPDPLRPRLRRRGADVADERAHRPDAQPGQALQLKQILFQANPERFQAYLAGELDAGTAPGLAVIFAHAQGMDMKIVASSLPRGRGQSSTSPPTYMVKDDGRSRASRI